MIIRYTSFPLNMKCFYCASIIINGSSLQVGVDYFHWNCVREIVKQHIKDFHDRENHINRSATELANQLGFKEMVEEREAIQAESRAAEKEALVKMVANTGDLEIASALNRFLESQSNTPTEKE